MPIDLNALFHLSSILHLKINSGLPGATNHPFLDISDSNCPGVQPAYPRAKREFFGPSPFTIDFSILIFDVKKIF